MRGNLRQRSRGSWTLTVELPRDASGKRRALYETFQGNKRQAQDRLAELIASTKDGYTVRPEKITVQEALSQWLRDHAPRVRARTMQGYESKLRYRVYPALGRLSLRDLQPSHVQALYRDMLAQVSARTVLHVHRILQESLDYAVKLGYISRNPCKAVTPPRPDRKEMRALSPQEVTRVLEAARATPYYALFHTALYTGLRRSEFLGLRVHDVDLTLGTIHVAQGLHVLNGGRITYTEPKSAKGKRMVALTPSSAIVLREHLAGLEANRLALGIPLEDNGLVFSWADGRPMLPNSVTRAWRRLVRGLGLTGVRLHDARHTHASLMLAQNIHPKIVQERLGHSTIAVTLDTYSHVAPGLQAAAALAFDKMLALDTEPERATEMVG
ncbi:MAG: site-specific integrase [Chloroflexi bacterium]|nr:site-specific integrase [Chloroflexota bacterium]